MDPIKQRLYDSFNRRFTGLPQNSPSFSSMHYEHNAHSTGTHVSEVMSDVQQQSHCNVSDSALMGNSQETQDVHNAAATFNRALKDGETCVNALSHGVHPDGGGYP